MKVKNAFYQELNQIELENEMEMERRADSRNELQAAGIRVFVKNIYTNAVAEIADDSDDIPGHRG